MKARFAKDVKAGCPFQLLLRRHEDLYYQYSNYCHEYLSKYILCRLSKGKRLPSTYQALLDSTPGFVSTGKGH